MGMYDELVDSNGKIWQTKSLFCEMRRYYPGDSVALSGAISTIEVISPGCNGDEVGIVVFGVWSGIVTDSPDMNDIAEAHMMAFQLCRNRNEELSREILRYKAGGIDVSQIY